MTSSSNNLLDARQRFGQVQSRMIRNISILLGFLLTAAAVGAEPPNYQGPETSQPPPASSAPGERADGPPRANADVYFYPKQGQSRDQQDRDRYECSTWVRRQTGFDPSLVHPDHIAPVRVVAVPPPGASVAGGAVAGAVVGAAVVRPRDAGQGAAVGAIAGALLGAVAGSSRQAAANAEQSRINAARESQQQRVDARALDYRRALTACLEGRGYSVQ